MNETLKQPDNNADRFKKLRDEKIDTAILAMGGISFYYKTAIIDQDLSLLADKGYTIIEFDGALMPGDAELHFFLGENLHVGSYGESFDALNDSLRDYEVPPNGVVLAFRKLDYLNPRAAFHLLDVLATHCRRNLAIGRRLIVLGQVENPRFTIKEPVGSLNFWFWNDQEWFEGDRTR